MESTTKRKATKTVSDKKVTAVFNTRCAGMQKRDGQGIEITFDFSGVTDTRIMSMAASTAIIDFQPVLRGLTASEAVEKYDGKTVMIEEERKRKTRTLDPGLVAFAAARNGTATEEQKAIVKAAMVKMGLIEDDVEADEAE